MFYKDCDFKFIIPSYLYEIFGGYFQPVRSLPTILWSLPTVFEHIQLFSGQFLSLLVRLFTGYFHISSGHIVITFGHFLITSEYVLVIYPAIFKSIPVQLTACVFLTLSLPCRPLCVHFWYSQLSFRYFWLVGLEKVTPLGSVLRPYVSIHFSREYFLYP